MQTTEVDVEYQRRVDAMSIKERIERSAAMLAWTRQQIARSCSSSRSRSTSLAVPISSAYGEPRLTQDIDVVVSPEIAK